MREFFEILFVLALGLVIGAGLSVASIRNENALAALTIGQWTAWPKAGSRDADPYTRARMAALGEVPLGAAEGIAFHGRQDQDGNPLLLECTYRLQGETPNARFWTLSAQGKDSRSLRNDSGRVSATHSRRLLFRADGTFDLSVGPAAQPGNWMETSGQGPFELVLRLYDSQFSGSSDLATPRMPSIRLMGCGS